MKQTTQIPGYYTFTEAGKLLGISSRRVAQLVGVHDVPVTRVHSRLNLIAARDLKRIPKDRPTGVHLGK